MRVRKKERDREGKERKHAGKVQKTADHYIQIESQLTCFTTPKSPGWMQLCVSAVVLNDGEVGKIKLKE